MAPLSTLPPLHDRVLLAFPAPRASSLKMGKPRGIRTGRHLRDHRRKQKWNDLRYKKTHLGTALKANPFGGASHAKGIVVEKMCVYLPGA